MRVLHVGKFYPPYMGGMETHLQALGGELRKRLDVQVIVANPGRRSVRETVDGVPVSRVGTAFTVASAQICPGMSRQIRAADADIVHLHHPNPTATFSLLASGYRGRVIVTYHSDIVRQKLLGAAFRPVLRRLLGRSAAIIVTSPNYLATSPELAPFRDRCHVIPYGISVGRFGERDETAIARIRREHGPRILLAVGRMIYYKGFEYLVRAMRDVDARLLLVGDGPLRPSLEQEAAALGIADRVTFLGEIQNDQITPYYHAADVFVLPSIARSEAFGIVQIEAMASGTPVVNTALDSGVPFVSLDGVTGLTVPPADSDALAGAINTLLGDHTRRAAFGVAARHRAEHEFSLEVMTQRTFRLYEEVIGSRSVAA